MSTLCTTSGPRDGDVYDDIANALFDTGYIILPGALPAGLVDALFVHFKSLDEDEFRPAGVGREAGHRINPFIRRDEIRWIRGEHPATADYLAWMEGLRLGLNRRLFMGLFEYECHYAHYPRGAYYKKHLDAFKGGASRLVTTVLYLNPAWGPNDGGELVLYAEDGEQVLETVAPQYGSLVVFLSECFPHEVRKAHRARFSLSGWFRVNGGLP